MDFSHLLLSREMSLGKHLAFPIGGTADKRRWDYAGYMFSPHLAVPFSSLSSDLLLKRLGCHLYHFITIRARLVKSFGQVREGEGAIVVPCNLTPARCLSKK